MLRLVDFHSHYVGPSFALNTRARVYEHLASPTALIASIENSGIAARVINTPLEFLQDADGSVSPDTVRINDSVAGAVSRHPGRRRCPARS